MAHGTTPPAFLSRTGSHMGGSGLPERPERDVLVRTTCSYGRVKRHALGQWSSGGCAASLVRGSIETVRTCAETGSNMVSATLRRVQHMVAHKRQTGGCAGNGQSLIELAIAVPIMLLIMLGTIDVGRLFFGYIEMTNAVREGSEYAAHQPAATDKIRSYVTRHAEDLPVASINVTCSNGNCDTAAAGDRVTVEATWQFTPMTGQFLGAFFGLPRFDLRVKSTMRVL
ncbi:MAG: hypothetical protein C4345_04270 [Chloroflexota bacterium]